MTTITKYYLTANGLTLKADLTPNNSGDPTQIGFYNTHAELDAALSANGSIGTIYEVRLRKEVTD